LERLRKLIGNCFRKWLVFWLILKVKQVYISGRNYWDGEGFSQIPPYIFTASKNGAVNRSRSETVLVMAPHGPYIYSVITKNQVDESWGPDNEGFVLLRSLFALLWNYFEAGSSWKPAIGTDGKAVKI
jgi:beta-lactamase class A